MNAALDLQQVHLVIFLSRATPLKRWAGRGLYSRETALFKALSQRVARLSLVSSGGSEELDFAADLAPIQILTNRWGLSPNLYSLLAPWLHRHVLRDATLFRTNQLDGAWSAVLAGRWLQKPVLVRVGYLWAELHRQEHGRDWRYPLISWLQRFSLRRASRVIVTSRAIRDHLVRSAQAPAERIDLIPNYVDTALFHPRPEAALPGQVCTVGRLSPVKNLPSLIQAIGGIPSARLTIIGDGPDRRSLESLARPWSERITFLGWQPHTALPQAIQRAELFVLPSLSEGHPKALIEAMACGVAVLGSQVPGIQEVIQHGENGWLCAPDADSLQQAIRTLLQDAGLRSELGRKARQFVLENYSLERIVALELQSLQRSCASSG